MKNTNIEKSKLYYGVLQVMCTYHERSARLEGHRIGIFLIDTKKKVGYNLCEQGKKYEIFRLENSLSGMNKMLKNVGNEVINEIVPLENVLKQFNIEYSEEDLYVENLSELKDKLEIRYNEIVEEKKKLEKEARKEEIQDQMLKLKKEYEELSR